MILHHSGVQGHRRESRHTHGFTHVRHVAQHHPNMVHLVENAVSLDHDGPKPILAHQKLRGVRIEVVGDA